jgi:hypothetical protein
VESVYELEVMSAESSLEYGPPETWERYTSYPATAELLGVHANATE